MKYMDFHCDTLTALLAEKQNLYRNQGNVDFARVSQFATQYVQMFALWKDAAKIKGERKDTFQFLYENGVSLFQQQKDIVWCKTRQELKNKIQQGFSCGAMTIEDLSVMGSLADEIENYPIVSAMLTWNYENEYGYGAMAQDSKGLKPAGKKMVETLTQKNIVLDVSHLSQGGFYDVCERTKGPFLASHSNAYAICPHVRNLRDEQIRILIERKGLIGLNLYRYFIQKDGICGIKEILKHVEHILALGGEKTLVLGCDFDGSDNEFPRGIVGVQSIETLYEAMLLENYNEEIIRGIFFENGRRFWLENA